MAKRVKLRRGTSAQVDNFIGAPAELTVDTDTFTLRVHDGVTLGGHKVGGSGVTSAVSGPEIHKNNYIPVWDGNNSLKLKEGYRTDNGINSVVILDDEGKLPPLDASQLIGLPIPEGVGNVNVNTSTLENYVPQWSSTDKLLKLGLLVGVGPSNLIQLDSESKLPAVDASQLTGISHLSLLESGTKTHTELESELDQLGISLTTLGNSVTGLSDNLSSHLTANNPHGITYEDILPSIVGKSGVLKTDGITIDWLAESVGSVSYVEPPLTNTSTGIKGQLALDNKFLYLCVADNTWARAPINLQW